MYIKMSLTLEFAADLFQAKNDGNRRRSWKECASAPEAVITHLSSLLSPSNLLVTSPI